MWCTGSCSMKVPANAVEPGIVPGDVTLFRSYRRGQHRNGGRMGHFIERTRRDYLQITHGNPDIPTDLSVAHLKLSVEAARQLGNDLRANAADQPTA